MKSKIKRFLENAPGVEFLIQAIKMYHHTKYNHFDQQNEFVQKYYKNKQPHVLSGPFMGMKYENKVYFGPVTPRWIGTYEMELHFIFDKINEFKPEEIIDVGSAEGYYSVGLAKIFNKVPVYSYETNPLLRYYQKRLSKINGATNLKIKNYCTKKMLIKHAQKRLFIICDIEGCEFELFSEAVVNSLTQSQVLIEIHKCEIADIKTVGEAIIQRFNKTHNIIYISMQPRVSIPNNINLFHMKDEQFILSSMNEFRSQNQFWLWCLPRDK